MQNKIKKRNRGYTIIETMISVSLFIVIVMAGMGALLNSNLLHQKSRDMRSIMDNLSFIMEDISKNLRTGYNYRCIDSSDYSDLDSLDVGTAKSGQNCWGIAFEWAYGVSANNNDQWVFLIDNGILKSTEGPYTDPSIGYVPMTPGEVVIDSDSGFTISGAEQPTICTPPDPACPTVRTVTGNLEQPFVTIRLSGKIISKDFETPFSLQTSVSQRAIDTR